MSTLEVTCSRCEKKLRVRAEFAGRSTRCPGCSAPITIGSAPKATPPPSRSEPDERPRSRPRDADDDEPRRPAANWKPVDSAFRREQVAVVFVLIGIVCDYFAFCLVRSAGQAGGQESIGTTVVLVFGVGPALAAAAFGIFARISALRPPPTSLARPSAVASLLCGLAGLGSLLILAFAMIQSMDSREPTELGFMIGGGGLVLSALASLVTFIGFVMQVGIVRKSASVSRAVGRLTMSISICLVALIGIGVMYALISELNGPPSHVSSPNRGSKSVNAAPELMPGAASPDSRSNGGSSSYRDHDSFYQIVLAILLPLALGVILIMYHRLLAAGRRALQSELEAREED
jgi:hypothetical protein